MDFFARQDHARALTRRLVWMFALAVIATVLGVNLVTYAGVRWYLEQERGLQRGHERGRPAQVESDAPAYLAPRAHDLQLQAQLVATVVTLLVIGLGSLFKTAQLRGGGPVVAISLGGRPAQPERDERERQLVNVVEEMSIASGVPMPQVYVLDQEAGINAFAAGLGQHDAVVAVTAGALAHFTRDELQGVIGHEFSHILNGDMRINLRLMGLIHGILVIALTGRLVMQLAANSGGSRRSDGKGNSALPFLIGGIALLVIGSIGYFFGQLIKAAISRQREFLADAAGVQFTRNPAGLGAALKKLGAGSAGSAVHAPRTSEASHLFFGRAVAAPLLGLLATHPPLEERIRAIDPQWDGTYPAADEVPPPTARSGAGPLAAGLVGTVSAARVVAQVGTVSPAQVAFGGAVLDDLPAPVHAAARDPFSARAVVIALLAGPDAARAVPLFDLLERAGDPALAREVRRLHPLVAALPAHARLPLIGICCPALQQLSPSQRPAFLGLLTQLAQADGIVSPAEYCLTRLVAVHLAPPAQRAAVIHSLPPLLAPAAVLLSALVRFGHADPQQQRAAFAVGVAHLLQEGGGSAALPLLGVDACGPAALDAALRTLGQAEPQLKRRIVDACAWTVAADGEVAAGEAELLRVVSMMLACPLPPFAGM